MNQCNITKKKFIGRVGQNKERRALVRRCERYDNGHCARTDIRSARQTASLRIRDATTTQHSVTEGDNSAMNRRFQLLLRDWLYGIRIDRIVYSITLVFLYIWRWCAGLNNGCLCPLLILDSFISSRRKKAIAGWSSSLRWTMAIPFKSWSIVVRHLLYCAAAAFMRGASLFFNANSVRKDDDDDQFKCHSMRIFIIIIAILLLFDVRIELSDAVYNKGNNKI